MTAWAGAAMARGVLLSDRRVPASRAPLWRSRELDLARCRPVVHAHSWAQCGKRGRTALTESATWSTRRPSDGRRVVQGDREPLWLRRGRRLLDTHSAAGGSTALARRVAKRIVNRAYVGPLPPVLERDDPAYGFPRNPAENCEGVDAFVERRNPSGPAGIRLLRLPASSALPPGSGASVRWACDTTSVAGGACPALPSLRPPPVGPAGSGGGYVASGTQGMYTCSHEGGDDHDSRGVGQRGCG